MNVQNKVSVNTQPCSNIHQLSRCSTKLLTGLVIALGAALNANANCLSVDGIKAIDAQYEQSIVNNDISFFEGILHPSFTWVHNHANYIQDSKAAMLRPMQALAREGKASHSTKRTQESVQVLIANQTAVAFGFTIVERPNSAQDSEGNKIGERYHFMRTYYAETDHAETDHAEVDHAEKDHAETKHVDERTVQQNACFLLSNHTMRIPQEDK
ncbi:nuclear transport factor 2 family protein [Ningiella sp. W23]|uniref:nuclear transport factor 2 family protein n=1 Tax=Ningiella sp. W23 TaxID=3023715 RepID=UPI003757CAE0